MIALRDAVRERLTGDALDLPPLPRVVIEVTEAVDADRDHAHLARIVRTDPAMAANVLRLANSPLFGSRRRIETLQQAITHLGTSELVAMAIAICARAKLFSAPGFEDLVDDMWRRALIAGVWAKKLARAIRDNVESAYLCGLLHGIGKPIVAREVAGVEVGRDQLEAMVDELYVEVGSRAGRSWKLPAAVIEAIEFHADPSGAPGRAAHARIAAASAALTEHVCDAEPETELAPDAFAALGLYPSDVAALLEDRDDVIAGAEAVA